MQGMQGKIRLAVIYGSTREGRFCEVVFNWLLGQLAGHAAYEVEVIDPSECVDGNTEEIDSRRIAASDAFIVVTPEYNHSYPGELKVFIDRFREEWHAKPVAFVSYGGISGGLRAVEHLRGVFAELHAVGLRDCVSFSGVWEQFDVHGELHNPGPASEALRLTLARLSWWASALRTARMSRSYAKSAYCVGDLCGCAV
jgi:NAD(P)H-dependent FMN reductase